MSEYVFVYVCVYACIYVCLNIGIHHYTCIYVCIYVAYMCMYVYMHVRMNVVCMHICLHARVQITFWSRWGYFMGRKLFRHFFWGAYAILIPSWQILAGAIALVAPWDLHPCLHACMKHVCVGLEGWMYSTYVSVYLSTCCWEIIEIVGGSEFHSFEVELGRGPSDHERQMVGRTGSSAQRLKAIRNGPQWLRHQLAKHRLWFKSSTAQWREAIFCQSINQSASHADSQSINQSIKLLH